MLAVQAIDLSVVLLTYPAYMALEQSSNGDDDDNAMGMRNHC